MFEICHADLLMADANFGGHLKPVKYQAFVEKFRLTSVSDGYLHFVTLLAEAPYMAKKYL